MRAYKSRSSDGEGPERGVENPIVDSPSFESRQVLDRNGLTRAGVHFRSMETASEVYSRNLWEPQRNGTLWVRNP
jgi:hypothetical protein